MTRLDRPMVAVQCQDAFRVRGVGGMAGDAVGQFAGLFTGFLDRHMAFDDIRLPDTGEVQIIVELGGRPDRARLNAAMGQGEGFAKFGCAALGKGYGQIIEQRGLIGFDREQVMRPPRENGTGELALGQKRIGSQRFAGELDFQRIDQGQESTDFIGLLGLLVAGAGQLADFF